MIRNADGVRIDGFVTKSELCCKHVKERLAIVKSNYLCFNCLCSHQLACRSKYRCRKCQGKYHTSICDQQTMSSSLNPNDIPFECSTFGIRRNNDATILYSSTQRTSNVLLKTAIAQVKSHNYSVMRI